MFRCLLIQCLKFKRSPFCSNTFEFCFWILLHPHLRLHQLELHEIFKIFTKVYVPFSLRLQTLASQDVILVDNLISYVTKGLYRIILQFSTTSFYCEHFHKFDFEKIYPDLMFQRGDRKLSSNSKFKHHRVLYVNIYTLLNRAIHYIGVGGGRPEGGGIWAF